MAKRKKHPKLPNGFGSIKYLGTGRRNPYAVHPPTKEFDCNGTPQTPKALCYTDDWYKGIAILTSHKAGTYTPGDEKSLDIPNKENIDAAIQKMLADYNRITRPQEKDNLPAFKVVYEEFYKYKYERDKSRTYSDATRYATRAAFINCGEIHERKFCDLRHTDLQSVIDHCPLKHSSLELIVSLLHQMYEYALIYEYVERDYSSALKINIPDDDQHGIPFSEKELKILWDNKADPVVEMILIMCYSGYRITAYKTIEINLENKYFKGGVKTRSSKERIVPIHSGIFDLVERRLKRDKKILSAPSSFRRNMYPALDRLKIDKHTHHDCRHTFSMLCQRYSVAENDRKTMMGHSFGKDITNAVYGHRSLEDLRTEIEKIEICY